MPLSVYLCVYLCACVCVFVCVYLNIEVCMYVCVCVCVRAYASVCVSIRVCVCTCAISRNSLALALTLARFCTRGCVSFHDKKKNISRCQECVHTSFSLSLLTGNCRQRRELLLFFIEILI